jgi:hypothetical protein
LIAEELRKDMIEIISRTFEDSIDFDDGYRVVYEIDGIRGDWVIEGADTDQKALDYLNALPAGWALENAEAQSIEKFGKSLVAPDYLTESPALPADAAEAKTWFEAEMTKPTKSHVLMTFCQYVMANDQDEFRNAYVQAIADLKNIEGSNDTQIENNLGDIVRGMATIQKKTLKALKKIFLG